MMPSHKKILALLQKKDMTIEDVIRKTKLSYDGIRGRISELNKLGHNIKKTGGRYRLTVPKKKKDADRLLQLADERRLYRRKITMTQLQDLTGFTNEELVDALSELYRRGQLLQMTKDTVIIYHI